MIMKIFSKSRGEKSRGINIPWMLIAIGFIFLVNPNISIIDPLPDFIGYIIISIALSKLSLLSETLADAKKSFERMILIDGAKILAIIWVFGIDSSSERASSLLLWCFVFSVLEGIFLIPSCVKLFKGISDLGDYHENVSIHSQNGKKSYTDRMKFFTLAFVVIKAIMTVLPEVSSLTNSSYDETASFVNMYRYIGIMRLLACVPVIIIGLAWICAILRYFKRIAKDVSLNTALENKYVTDVLPKKGAFVIRDVKIVSWLLVISAVLSLDFVIEGRNIIPDVFVLAALIPAFLFMCKNSRINKKGFFVSAAFYGVICVLAALLNYFYLENYTYNALDKDAYAFYLYMATVVCQALQGISFVILLKIGRAHV